MLRKTKGEIRKDLAAEYNALGRPGKGKSITELIAGVEVELSKNLEFRFEKAPGISKGYYLACGKDRVLLPAKNAWKTEIYKEPSTGIPFISDGRVSVRCVEFFQQSDIKSEKNEKTEKNDEKKTSGAPSSESSKKPAQFEALSVPLPGARPSEGIYVHQTSSMVLVYL